MDGPILARRKHRPYSALTIARRLARVEMRRCGFCVVLLLTTLATSDRAFALAIGDLAKPASQKKAGSDDVDELLKRFDRDNSGQKREFDAPRTQLVGIVANG